MDAGHDRSPIRFTFRLPEGAAILFSLMNVIVVASFAASSDQNGASVDSTTDGETFSEDASAPSESNSSTDPQHDSSAVDVTPRHTGDWFQLHRLDAFVDLRVEFERSNIETPGRRIFERDHSQKNRTLTFEESLGFNIGGHLVDPAFLTFGGSFSFGLSQARWFERFDGVSQSDRDSGSLLRYDFRANVLPGKPISGSVYGLRNDDRINRRFQPTLHQDRNGFGTTWVFADETFPMTLSYDYLDTDRTGNRDRSDDEHYTQSTFRYQGDWHIDEHQKLRYSFEHTDNRQEYQGLNRAYETKRDLVILDHNLEFGESHAHRLRTRLRWQEERGDFARDLFDIGPQVIFKHSDRLQTSLRYQFNTERYEGLDVETHRVDWQLVHQLYSNLTTTVDLFALYEDVDDDVNTVQYGGLVDWQYNKENRWGHFYANFALGYDTEHTRGDDGERLVLDEAVTFRDPVAVTLRNRNVVLTSVVVTDAGNLRIYRPAVDYVLIRTGNATQIRRLITGRIEENETVLVDYRYDTPGDGQLDTERVDFRLEQRLDSGLTPYYRLSYRNQEDDSSTGYYRRADRTNHHRIGVTYNQPRYSVGSEFEIFDDTVDPYDAFHLNGRLSILDAVQHDGHSLEASARFSRLFFNGGFDDRDVSLLDFSVDHRWRVNDWLSTIERVAFRFEDDSLDGLTRGWDVTAGLEFLYGDLSGELTVEYDRLDLTGSLEDDIGIYFRIRRELPNLLANRTR